MPNGERMSALAAQEPSTNKRGLPLKTKKKLAVMVNAAIADVEQ